jgi:hypothetical protein
MEIYSTRWTIEVFFKEAKQLLGLGQMSIHEFWRAGGPDHNNDGTPLIDKLEAQDGSLPEHWWHAQKPEIGLRRT